MRRHTDSRENERARSVHGGEDGGRSCEQVRADHAQPGRETEPSRVVAPTAHGERDDQRDDAHQSGELDECTEAADHAGCDRVVRLGEHHGPQERDADEDVVATTVHEVERGHGVQREERDRVGGPGASPDEHARERQRAPPRGTGRRGACSRNEPPTTNDAAPDTAVNTGP